MRLLLFYESFYFSVNLVNMNLFFMALHMTFLRIYLLFYYYFIFS